MHGDLVKAPVPTGAFAHFGREQFSEGGEQFPRQDPGTVWPASRHDRRHRPEPAMH